MYKAYVATLGLLLLVCPAAAQAQDGLMGGLWPFSRKPLPGTIAAGPVNKSLPRSDLGLDQSWGGSPYAEQAVEKPSMGERFAAGTRSAWDNTVGRILPGKKEPPRSPYARPEPKKPSLWSRMFKPTSTYQPPQTLKEWQAQPRVGSLQ